MASVAQIVSEFAHELGQPNNYALRENIKSLILHTRNELIRHSYENHGYMDKVHTQRFRVSLIDVFDGDITPEKIEGFDDVDLSTVDIAKIKRTKQRVPRPVRLTNNLPFDRVSSVGYRSNREFPYIKEGVSRFKLQVPGLKAAINYDYINGYIYLFPNMSGCSNIDNIGKIVIESAFENPTPIEVENGLTDAFTAEVDENEWLLSEDMIGNIKDIINKRDLLQTVRQTNEIPNTIKFK